MKFKGHGIVWDENNNAALCKFEGGYFETDDSYIYGKLTEAGYEVIETGGAEPQKKRGSK